MRLVLIEWVDSVGCSSSWADIETPFPKPHVLTCRSVGWLGHDGDDCKVLIPHVAEVKDDADQGCGDMTIPTVAITRMIDLVEKGSSKCDA